MEKHIDSDYFVTFTYDTEEERNKHCREMAGLHWVITCIKGGINTPLYASFEKWGNREAVVRNGQFPL